MRGRGAEIKAGRGGLYRWVPNGHVLVGGEWHKDLDGASAAGKREAFAKFRERGSALQAVKNLQKAGTMRWHSAVDHLSSSWRTPSLKEIDRQIRTRLTLAATHWQGLAKTWIWDMSLFREQFAILGQASRLRHGRFAGCSKRIAGNDPCNNHWQQNKRQLSLDCITP